MTDLIRLGIVIDPSGATQGAAASTEAFKQVESSVEQLSAKMEQYVEAESEGLTRAERVEAQRLAAAKMTAAQRAQLYEQNLISEKEFVQASLDWERKFKTDNVKLQLQELLGVINEETRAFKQGKYSAEEYAASLESLRGAAQDIKQSSLNRGVGLGPQEQSMFNQVMTKTVAPDAGISQFNAITTAAQRYRVQMKAGTMTTAEFNQQMAVLRQEVMDAAGAMGQMNSQQLAKYNSALRATDQAATRLPRSMGRTTRSLASMTAVMAGANSRIGSLTTGFLMMSGLSLGWIFGLSLAVAGATAAWDLLTKKQKAYKKAIEDIIKAEDDRNKQRERRLNPEGTYDVQIKQIQKLREETATKLKPLMETLFHAPADQAGAAWLETLRTKVGKLTTDLTKYNRVWRELQQSQAEDMRSNAVGQAKLTAETLHLSDVEAQLYKARAEGYSPDQLQKLRTYLYTIQNFHNEQTIKALKVQAESLGMTERQAGELALTLQVHLSPAVRQATIDALAAKEAFGAQQFVQSLRDAAQATRSAGVINELYQLTLKRLPPAFEAEARAQILAKDAMTKYLERQKEALERAKEHRDAVTHFIDTVISSTKYMDQSRVSLTNRAAAMLHMTAAEKSYALAIARTNDELQTRSHVDNNFQPGVREREVAAAEKWHDTWKSAIDDISSTMVDYLSSAADQGINMFEAMAKTVQQILKQIATELLKMELYKLIFGSATGGIIPDAPNVGDPGKYIPKSVDASSMLHFHSGGIVKGLAPGEVPIIAKEGERIIPAGAMQEGKTEQHFHFSFQSVDATGMEQLIQRSKGPIAQVVLDAVKQSRAYQAALIGR